MKNLPLTRKSRANAAELNALANIALKCPTTFGRAVHKARALRAFIEGFPRLYEDNCDNEPYNNGARLAETANLTPNREILVYPNPAKNEVTIEIPFKDALKLCVFNVEGRKVYETTTNDVGFYNLNTSEWTTGMYVLHFTGNDYSKTHKLVIIK